LLVQHRSLLAVRLAIKHSQVGGTVCFLAGGGSFHFLTSVRRLSGAAQVTVSIGSRGCDFFCASRQQRRCLWPTRTVTGASICLVQHWRLPTVWMAIKHHPDSGGTLRIPHVHKQRVVHSHLNPQPLLVCCSLCSTRRLSLVMLTSGQTCQQAAGAACQTQSGSPKHGKP
jgi:hypothetical protein